MPLNNEKSKFAEKNLLRKVGQDRYEKDGFSLNVQDKERFLRESFEKDPWEGFTLVFNHYYRPVCSRAIRFVYSHTHTEDIVSEVFTEFWKKEHYKKLHTRFRAYLFQAVLNRSMNFIRKEQGREAKQIEEDFMMTSALSPEEHMVYEQIYQRVQKGIEHVPPKCKTVIMMSRFEGKTMNEIARHQNISIRTVDSHLSNVCGRMREILDVTDGRR